jgi:hypothetical protein
MASLCQTLGLWHRLNPLSFCLCATILLAHSGGGNYYRGMANMNRHDANEYGSKDECEQKHVRMNKGVHTRERGDAREERRRRGHR